MEVGRKVQLYALCRPAPKLRGRYLGYIRQLKPRQRAEVMAVREMKGIEEVIKKAQRFAGK